MTGGDAAGEAPAVSAPVPAPAPAALELTAALRRSLDDAGFAHREAPVSVAGELAEILADLVAKGQVAEDLLAEYRESLTFSYPEAVGTPQALIVVASRSLPVKVRFHLESGPFE